VESEELAQYEWIAINLAERISKGEFSEGEKLSGRSKLSSEYDVSPETIRKAMQLLCDMKVVLIKEKSGIYVRSTDNARHYLSSYNDKAAFNKKKQKLSNLIAQQNELNREIVNLGKSILNDAVIIAEEEDYIPTHSFRIPHDWEGIGKSLGKLCFWEATGSTVVAIKRGGFKIVSPGPNAELYEDDVIIFVGDPGKVENYFS